MGTPKKATPRVREHVNTLREAGGDTQKFFDALVTIRDDSALPRAHRDSLYRLVAMESFVWYLEAIRNEQIDRMKLAEEINKLTEEYSAAIRTEKQGERATELLKRDIGADPQTTPTKKASAPPAQPADEQNTKKSNPVRNKLKPKTSQSAPGGARKTKPAPGVKPAKTRKSRSPK